jgi:parallel beta-helix repeat protein
MRRRFVFLAAAALALRGLAGVPAAAATYHTAASSGADTAPGTAAAPFRTIQRGVDALKPGDTLLIGPGVYRERVSVARGGTKAAPLTIAAAPGARVVVTGADRLRGWEKVAGNDPVFVHDNWNVVLPINRRADGTLELSHPGDKRHELIGRAEQVIAGERMLRQVLQRGQLAPGTFFAALDAKKLYAWLATNEDPNGAEMEASTRSEWLVTEPGANFVRLRGLTFRYAANHAQRGAFRLGNDYGRGENPNGWVIEDCVFERANGPGASLAGSGHVLRRCAFTDNGQLGFGASRCHDSRLENCRIERNNTKGYSTGWEAGGCKVTLSRGFVFDGCRAVDNRGPGIWYDIGNEKAEVKNCFIEGNDEAGIFYEISYGLHAHNNLIVNNANRGEAPGGAWGMGGVTLSSSENCVVENNTFAFNRDGLALREHERTTPRINDRPGAAEVRIFNRNHLVRNNVIAYSQAFNIALWMDTTFFGPHPSGGDNNKPASEDPRTLNLRFENNLLAALPGRPNYLYGASWRSKSRQPDTPAAFAQTSGLDVSGSRAVSDPGFRDARAGDFSLSPTSPARAVGAGPRPAAALRTR